MFKIINMGFFYPINTGFKSKKKKEKNNITVKPPGRSQGPKKKRRFKEGFKF